MTGPADRPCLVAYDTVSGAVVLIGTDARYMLAFLGDHLWPRIDPGLVEVVDLGPDGMGQGAKAPSLAAARTRFRTVYRGAGVADLPPIPLDAVRGARQPGPP